MKTMSRRRAERKSFIHLVLITGTEQKRVGGSAGFPVLSLFFLCWLLTPVKRELRTTAAAATATRA